MLGIPTEGVQSSSVVGVFVVCFEVRNLGAAEKSFEGEFEEEFGG
jgi:hypothetical protein